MPNGAPEAVTAPLSLPPFPIRTTATTTATAASPAVAARSAGRTWELLVPAVLRADVVVRELMVLLDVAAASPCVNDAS
jgi:hypothetical protein